MYVFPCVYTVPFITMIFAAHLFICLYIPMSLHARTILGNVFFACLGHFTVLFFFIVLLVPWYWFKFTLL